MSEAQTSEVRARLFCQTGKHRGQSFFLGQEADIGSAPAAKITIKSSEMAQHQARIRYSPRLGAYVLENLSKSNPLLLDGRAVTRPRRLGDLHVLTLPGGHDYIFQVLHEEVGAATSPGLFVKYVPTGLMEESKRDPSQRPEPKTSFDQVVPTPAVFAQEEDSPKQDIRGRDAHDLDLKDQEEEAVRARPSADVDHPPSRKKPEEAQAPSPATGQEPSAEEDTQAGAAIPLPSLPGDGAESGASAGEQAAAGEERVAQGRERLDAASEAGAQAAHPSPEGVEASAETTAADESPLQASPESAAASADAPAADSFPDPSATAERRSGFLLMVAEEAGTSRSYPLREGKNLVGRMDDCQVVLGHKAVSRRQASLLVSPGRVVVSDLGGLNATLVDGQPLQGEIELRPGQELRMGPFRATLVRRGGEAIPSSGEESQS